LSFTVLSREYCHLCHDMIDALKEVQQTKSFEFRVIDVDENPEWEEKYGELVPVLLAGDEEICHYHLDYDALNAYLAKIR
jgi:glutaredoxin